MQATIKPRRSPRLAAKAAAAAAADRKEAIALALESYHKIQAACKAALQEVEARKQQEMAAAGAAHAEAMLAAMEAAAAVLKEERAARRQARKEADEAWDAVLELRQKLYLNAMMGEDKEEQKRLEKQMEKAYAHLETCMKYCEALGVDEYYEDDEDWEEDEEEDEE